MSSGNSTRRAEQVARLVEEAGMRVRRTKSGYVAYGKDGVRTVAWHKSPSDGRAWKNLRAELRKIGVEI